jgi:tRNA (Thr-GGU) A37 N-methylase
MSIPVSLRVLTAKRVVLGFGRCLSRRRSLKVISAMDIHLSPIGWVRSEENGPREDYWGEVISEIVLDHASFLPTALEGLSEFSHIEVLDAVNGSPVIDIKPVFAEFVPDRALVRQPAWSHEMMANYFKRTT